MWTLLLSFLLLLSCLSPHAISMGPHGGESYVLKWKVFFFKINRETAINPLGISKILLYASCVFVSLHRSTIADVFRKSSLCLLSGRLFGHQAQQRGESEGQCIFMRRALSFFVLCWMVAPYKYTDWNGVKNRLNFMAYKVDVQSIS